MASFNVLFFDCDHVRKDGDFQVLDNSGEVLCKWLVENIDENGLPVTEERDFKAMVLFQSSVKKQCLVRQKIFEDLMTNYSGTMQGLKKVLLQRAEEEKQFLLDCGSQGSAGKLKRALLELQAEEIAEKRCKENKVKQNCKDNVRAHAERAALQTCAVGSQLNLQKLENLTLLVGMASVLHPNSTSNCEKQTTSESPVQCKDLGQNHAIQSPCQQQIPKKLFPSAQLAGSSNELTPTRSCKPVKVMVHSTPYVSTLQSFIICGYPSHGLASSQDHSAAATTDMEASGYHDDMQDDEESFHLVTEESKSLHTGEMVYNSLAIINDNKIYSSGQGSCPNEACAILQAKVTALQAENERLKAQLQGNCRNELAIQHLQAALSALTSSRVVTYSII